LQKEAPTVVKRSLAPRRLSLLALGALLAAVALEVRADDGQYKVGDPVASFSAVNHDGKAVGPTT
jgi:hypothetical protein